jgi:DNA repair exonuclease SbcCD ATPase subunit
MSDLLEVLRTHSEECKAASERAYRVLVVTLSSTQNQSDQPDPEDLLHIVEEAGKTVEQLERDVQTRKQRVEAAATLKDEPAVEKERRKVESRLAELHSELEQLQAEYRLKIGQQNRVMKDLGNKASRFHTARHLLESTAAPELLGRLREAAQEHGRLSVVVAGLQAEFNRVAAVAGRDMPPPVDVEARPKGHFLRVKDEAAMAERKAIERAIARRDELRGELDQATQELDQVAAQMRALRAELLVP